MGAKAKRISPYRRWQQIAELVQLCVVSTMVENIEAPLNLLLVGPPGDGKTAMLLRAEKAHNVEVLSDTTYLGLCSYLRSVRDGLTSCLIIPDMGTIVGRKSEVGKQAIATMAMMAAEGVSSVRVGKRVHDFMGARASVISAITGKDLISSQPTLEQNAFLSRVFLVDFDLTFEELYKMMERKSKGDRRLLSRFRFPQVPRDGDGEWVRRPVYVPRTHSRKAMRWWKQLRRTRPDRWFAFRSADSFVGLMQAAAYLHGRRRVTMDDVKYLEREVLPLIQQQVTLVTKRTEGE